MWSDEEKACPCSPKKLVKDFSSLTVLLLPFLRSSSTFLLLLNGVSVSSNIPPMCAPLNHKYVVYNMLQPGLFLGICHCPPLDWDVYFPYLFRNNNIQLHTIAKKYCTCPPASTRTFGVGGDMILFIQYCFFKHFFFSSSRPCCPELFFRTTLLVCRHLEIKLFFRQTPPDHFHPWPGWLTPLPSSLLVGFFMIELNFLGLLYLNWI